MPWRALYAPLTSGGSLHAGNHHHHSCSKMLNALYQVEHSIFISLYYLSPNMSVDTSLPSMTLVCYGVLTYSCDTASIRSSWSETQESKVVGLFLKLLAEPGLSGQLTKCYHVFICFLLFCHDIDEIWWMSILTRHDANKLWRICLSADPAFRKMKLKHPSISKQLAKNPCISSKVSTSACQLSAFVFQPTSSIDRWC